MVNVSESSVICEKKLMLSPFGTWIRAFRREQKITLREMARKLGKAPSYLSAIELGRKSVPDTILDELEDAYKFDPQLLRELERVIQTSKLGADVKFKSSTSVRDRELVMLFARNFEKFDEEDKSKLLELMENYDEQS